MKESSSERKAAGPQAIQRRWVVLGLVAAVLGCFAYRDLLFPSRPGLLEPEISNWFFRSGHGSARFAALLALWLVVRRRGAFRALPPGASNLAAALPPLLAGAATLGWACYAQAPDLGGLSLAFTGLGLALAWGGTRALRLAALPVVVALLGTPIPAPLYNALVWKLQLWTTGYAAWLLELLGSSVAVTGDVILLGDRVFEVVEPCSGLRGIEILLLLTILMADLFELRRWAWIVLLALAPLSAFAANGIRVAWIALTSDMDAATGHVGQGVLTLLGGAALQFGFLLLLERLDGGRRGDDLVSEPAPRGGARLGRWLAVAAGCAALLATVSLSVPPVRKVGTGRIGVPILFPEHFGQWVSSDREPSLAFLGSARFREVVWRVYRLEDDPEGPDVELFVGIGAREERFASPFARKTRLPGPGWVPERDDPGESPFRNATMRVLVVKGGQARRLVYHFTAGNLGLMRESLRALLAIDSTPIGDARDGVVVRLSTPIDADPTTGRRRARARLDRFVLELRPALMRIRED